MAGVVTTGALPPGDSSASWPSWRVHAVLVATVALLAYAGSIPSGFVFDDQVTIQTSPVVQGAVPLGEVFTRDWWGHRPELSVGSYRPLAVLAFWVEWRLGEGSPVFFHLVNVLLHVVAVTLLFLVFRGIIPERVALAAALICAVGAPSSEAVEGIVGQSDLLETIGILIGLAAHRRAGLRAAAVATLALALALGTKESGVVAIVAWTAFDLVLPPSVPWRQRAGRFGAYLAAIAGYFVLRYEAIGTLRLPLRVDAMANPLQINGTVARVFGAGRVFLTRYVAGWIDPRRRLYDCSARACMPSTPSDPVAWAGILLMLSLVVLTVVMIRRAPAAAAGLGWFLVFFVPVSNFLITATLSYGERILYLPMIGLGLAVAVATDALARRLPRPAVAWGLFAAVLVVHASCDQLRHLDWRSAPALSLAGLRYSSNSALVLANNAMDANNRNDFQSGEGYARRAIAEWPDYGYGHRALAIALDHEGRTDDAEREFRASIAALPQSDIVSDYGVFLARHGRYTDAMQLVQQRLAADPAYPALVDLQAKLVARVTGQPGHNRASTTDPR